MARSQPLRPLHYARVPGIDDAGDLRQRLRHHAGAWHGGHPHEMVHETRIIKLDNSPRSGQRTHMGDVRGHWEGNTLVVETTNMRAPYRNGSAKQKLIERFVPTAPGIIEWSMTVDDPDTWVRPWTFAMRLTADPDQPPGVRLPRRQLRDAQHPERRARRRSESRGSEVRRGRTRPPRTAVGVNEDQERRRRRRAVARRRHKPASRIRSRAARARTRRTAAGTIQGSNGVARRRLLRSGGCRCRAIPRQEPASIRPRIPDIGAGAIGRWRRVRSRFNAACATNTTGCATNAPKCILSECRIATPATFDSSR